jgi:hypothetical protein
MRVVSRKWVTKRLSGGSFLGFIRVLILVWVRVWGLPMRLMGTGMPSTIVPGQCERRAFARGVYFCTIYELVSVNEVVVTALFSFTSLDFVDGGVSAYGSSDLPCDVLIV